jgi:gas vesicle protein
MKTDERNTPAAPVLLAMLAGAGAGMLAGVLLAPMAGPALRQNIHGMAHKYALLASEQQQQLNHHLALRAGKLGVAYKDLACNCQGQLMRWGLLTPPARLPY